MHWLMIVAGLWMMSPAQAEEPSGAGHAAASTHATAANAALTLDDATSATEPPADPAGQNAAQEQPSAADPAVEPAAGQSQRKSTPVDAAEGSLYPPASAGEKDAQPVAHAPRRIIPRGAHARPEAEPDAAPVEEESTTIGRTLTPAVPWYRGPYAALAGVLVIIAVLTVLARRFVPTVRPMGGGALRVVGRVPVGAKQSAALLQVGRRVVLVGIGPDGLRTLTEITDAQEVALLLGKSSSAAPAENFDHLLAEELEAYDATEEDAETPQEAARESLQATRGQLESLRSRIRALQSA